MKLITSTLKLIYHFHHLFFAYLLVYFYCLSLGNSFVDVKIPKKIVMETGRTLIIQGVA